MRKISKTPVVPRSLLALKAPASAKDINDNAYKGSDVKKLLRNDQHSKCIYCECRLNGDYGHVEHFRPKGGYAIPPSSKLFKPGYFWLAYEWNNLLLSCSTCNTSYKQNFFALEDESTRDIAGQDISRESPLLIDPSKENPADFIEFHEHVLAPKMIDGVESRKGRYTIDLLGLNERSDLVAYRRAAWETFENLKKKRTIAVTLIERGFETECGETLLKLVNEDIESMKSESAEYSAMFASEIVS